MRAAHKSRSTQYMRTRCTDGCLTAAERSMHTKPMSHRSFLKTFFEFPFSDRFYYVLVSITILQLSMHHILPFNNGQVSDGVGTITYLQKNGSRITI
ncbi:hypothetical protein BYT27DRAFT_7200621 [Phlegmacium glaucopus]|nr:hypothetical protein BYT27DRAFT_7200621 [Phlegmacium glaucopus]